MITIIIPSYQPGDYLKECLQSIENQNLDKREYKVLIVLNGEKQPYYSVINNWIENLNCNIKIITTEKIGVSNARNIGIENAEGEYIMFLDDDDKISNNYLKELYSCIKYKNNSIAVSKVLTFDDDGHIGIDYISKAFINSDKEDCNNLFKMRRFMSSSCCKIIPRSIIGDFRFNPSFCRGEDSLFMAEISGKIDSILLASEQAIYYRRLRKGSATRSKNRLRVQIKNRCRLISQYLKVYKSDINGYSLPFFLSRIIAQIIKW